MNLLVKQPHSGILLGCLDR
jgi:hypothetical protein